MCLGVGKKLRGCLVSPASPEKLYDYCVLLCALFLKPSPPVRVAFSPVKRERDHCKSFSNSWPLSLTRVCASISFTENSLNRRVSIERSAICRKLSTLLRSAFLFFCLLQQEKMGLYRNFNSLPPTSNNLDYPGRAIFRSPTISNFKPSTSSLLPHLAPTHLQVSL